MATTSSPRLSDGITSVTGPDGPDLAVHELGGDGPAVLFSHATGLHGGVWRPVARSLGDGFRGVAVDLRGHGDSTLPPGDDLGWEGFARDIAALVAALGRDPLFGVGHSLGGTALLMAEIDAPGTFEHLVLYEPAIAFVRSDEQREQLDRLRDAMVGAASRRRRAFPSAADALSHYASKPPMSEWSAESLHAYVTHGLRTVGDAVELKCSPGVEAAAFDRTHDHGYVARLDEVRCPVTVLVGAASDPLQRAASAELATVLGADLLELEHLSHFGPLEDPPRVASAARARLVAASGHPPATEETR